MKSPKQWVSEMELAWAAGFFDGEGWTGSYRQPNRLSVDLRMHVSQTNLAVLERFQAAVGCGRIEKMRDKPGRKPVWRWKARGQEVVDVAAKLFDHLCEPKQDQMMDAIGARLAYEELKATQERAKTSGHSRLRLVS